MAALSHHEWTGLLNFGDLSYVFTERGGKKGIRPIEEVLESLDADLGDLSNPPIEAEELRTDDQTQTMWAICLCVEIGCGSCVAANAVVARYATSCVLVRPLQAVEGSLTITSSGMLFRPAQGEANAAAAKGLKRPRTEMIWKEDIARIRLRRYHLQRTSMEIFRSDCTSIFLHFPKKDRKTVLQHILAIHPPHMSEIFAGPEEELKRTNLTERWRRREISNFEYLMELNDMAGRSCNDLSQYYVFPWGKSPPAFCCPIATAPLLFI